MNVFDSCIGYESSISELFIPSPIILSTLCLSTDRTNLFLVSLIRIVFYVVLYYVMNDLMGLAEHQYVKYILLVIIIINILYLGVVVAKNPVFSVGSGMSILGKIDEINQKSLS